MQQVRHLLAIFSASLLVFIAATGWAGAAPIQVVAAESTYGVIAEAVGGPYVQVTSIISNPDVDPHLFEASPAVARDVARARVVVMNGIGYDGWMAKILAANPNSARQVVVAADLASNLIMTDKNPHIFYDPRVALLVAARLAAIFGQMDPAHAAQFQAGLQRFTQGLLPVYGEIQQIIAAHPNLAVTGTEPVYGYMLRLLGYKVLNQRLQQNVMNNTEPAPQEVAAFEQSLRTHRAALFVYNEQVQSPLTQRLKAVAQQAGVPVVGVAEFVPPHTGYAQWQIDTLRAVAAALARGGR